MTLADTDSDFHPAWTELLDRWDAQQGVYIQGREHGYKVMLAVLDALLPHGIVALDLAAGPGSLSKRLLDHRPDARAIAVDIDPVLQAVGRGALGDMGGRLRWLAADLREPNWVDHLDAHLDDRHLDAVLTSTATHWLQPSELAVLYHALAGLLRPGGVFVNFDGFPPTRPTSRIDTALGTIDRARQERAVQAGAEAWQDWWDAARELPALCDAFVERDGLLPPARGRIFADSVRTKGTSLAFHAAALVEAGFSEVDVVWQDLHKRILVAVP